MLNGSCLSVSCFVETKGVVFIWSTVSFRQVIRESTHSTLRSELKSKWPVECWHWYLLPEDCHITGDSIRDSQPWNGLSTKAAGARVVEELPFQAVERHPSAKHSPWSIVTSKQPAITNAVNLDANMIDVVICEKRRKLQLLKCTIYISFVQIYQTHTVILIKRSSLELQGGTPIRWQSEQNAPRWVFRLRFGSTELPTNPTKTARPVHKASQPDFAPVCPSE